MGRALGRWVEWVTLRPRSVVAGTLAITVGLLLYTAGSLRLDPDNIRLIAKGLEFRQAFEELTQVLPVLNKSLIVVVDAETPAQARRTADRLAERLEGSDTVHAVFRPGGGPFFEEHGLLYRDIDDLERLADELARLQPILAMVERNPTVAALADRDRLDLERERTAPRNPELWAEVLAWVRDGVKAAQDGGPPLDWERILSLDPDASIPTRQVIFVEPRQGSRDPAAARRAMTAIRAAARELARDEGATARVRITGYPALAEEEKRGLLRDAGTAGIASFLLVVWILLLALRSGRLVAAAAATLCVGLTWTAAFAAFAIGSLNVVSVTFAVLFIGLGVDFAIHFGSDYVDRLQRGVPHTRALCETAEKRGDALALCTVSTAVGFYVFVPTDYRGVAELGAIAGTGMLIIFLHTFTLLPALLSSWLRLPAPERLRSPVRFRSRWWQRPLARPGAVCGTAAALGALATLVLPRLEFDPNVIRLRDPGTESVQAFEDLLSNSGLGTPWYADVLASDLDHADAIAAKLRSLAVVERAITLRDLVPDEQADKRAILADVAFMLNLPERADTTSAQPGNPVASLELLLGSLRTDWPADSHPELVAGAHSLADGLDGFLSAIRARPGVAAAGPMVANLETALLADFPRAMARLRRALEADHVDLDDLPDPLVRRMLAPDGRARVQAFPSEDLNAHGAHVRFADGVRAVVPRATGLAVNLVEFGRVTASSLVQALSSALVAIALLLWLLDRRVSDVLLVLAPLTLAGLLTAAVMVLLDLRINFANVIVLPLLLGVGVDSGIHLVRRWREGDTPDESILETPTARAVYYSALTTTASFGTLAFSANRGIASLGLVLAIGMAFTLLANLIVLPAMLTLQKR